MDALAHPLPPAAVALPLAPLPTCLADLGAGASAVVHRVEGAGTLRRRLMELGFVPGTVVRLVRRAPLRDPLEVELCGYHLSLRRSEALVVRLVPTPAGR